ncbi:MAG: hypothetical protein Q8O86_00410 [Dehalococcoidia bacterium]|nr:hypothetical protein [Dehalococcoidia bacterium]
MRRALSALGGVDGRLTGGLADFLEDRCRFDFAQRWLDAMAETGDPRRTAAKLDTEMAQWEASKDMSHRTVREIVLRVVGTAAAAYVHGLHARGREPVLVLADVHESPFADCYGMRGVQWDIFPSAACRLRGQRRGDPDKEARVAVVPSLWVDALRRPDEPFMGGRFVVLEYDLDTLCWTVEACSAVSDAVSRSCHAGVLSCRERYPTDAIRIKYEGLARKVAASALARLK